MSENKLSEIIKTSLDNIKAMTDANTVIGDPISTANGTTIIPVSKIFVGYASGGIDYAAKNAPAGKLSPNNFGGGGGTGLTVSPVAFLIISPDGTVNMLNINNPENKPTDPVSTVANLVERSPEIIEKFKEIFRKKGDDAETSSDDDA